MLYEFTATGPANHQCWRRVIPANRAVRLGRAPQHGWAVPWDLRISREHADLILANDRLRVRRLSTARNRIYVHGEPLEEFSISPGEDFRIGRTTFQMSVSAASPSDSHPSRDEVSSGSETDLKALARQPTRRRLAGILQELAADEPANGGSVGESP